MITIKFCWRLRAGAFFLMSVALASHEIDGQEFDTELAKKATLILREYCKSCHGEDYNYPQLDVASRDALLAPNGKGKKPFIVPGDVDASRVWARITATDSAMPPEYMPQLSEDQKQTIKKWIIDGAFFPEVGRPKRAFVGESTILDAIDNDLRELEISDQKYVRYQRSRSSENRTYVQRMKRYVPNIPPLPCQRSRTLCHGRG